MRSGPSFFRQCFKLCLIAVCGWSGSAPAQNAPVGDERTRVVDETGRPLEGVRVYVQQRPHFPIPEEVKESSPTLTGADGMFTPPEDVPPGALIVVAKPGFITRGFSAGEGLPREIDLYAGERLVGGVVDDEGVSVTGAMIGPAFPQGRITADGARTQPLLYARSGPDGGFELSGVSRGRQEVLFQAPGFSPRLVTINPGSYKKVDLETGGTTVTGAVRGSRDQAPKVGAYVEASAPGIKLYTRSDENGRFTFTSLPEQEWQFRAVVSDGKTRNLPQTLQLKAQPEPYEVNVVMSQGVRVGGYAYDPDTSAPLADLTLTLDTEARRQTRTDAEGKFVFEDVDLLAEPMLRFDSTRYSYSDPLTGENREWVQIPAFEGEEITTLTLPLRSRPTFTGRVMDLWQRPVSHAVIRARALQEVQIGKQTQRPEFHSRSRSDGSFRLPVPMGGEYELVAGHEQMVSEIRVADVWTTSPTELTLELKPAAAISGTVVDSLDQPVSGAAVEVRAASPTGSSEPETVGTGRLIQSTSSNERGYFEVTGFAPVAVDVVARHPDFGQKAATTADLRVATSSGMVLKFPGGEEFSVVVKRQEGGAVQGAEIRAYYTYGGQQRVSTAESDGEGRAAFRSIPTRELDHITVREPRFVDFEEYNVQLPQKEFPVVLRSRGSAEVLVDDLSQETDSPEPVTVMLMHVGEERVASPGAPEAASFTVVESKLISPGKVTFDRLDPGWYKAAVRRGALYAESEAKQLADSRPMQLHVVLEEGGIVQGKVVDKATNQALKDAVVSVSPASAAVESEPVRAVTGADGAFVLVGAPAGAMRLTALHSSYPDHEEQVVVPTRGAIEVIVNLSSEMARLTGSVRMDNTGLPDALLVLHKAGEGEAPAASAVSDSSGRYEFDGVAPGRYILTVEGGGSDTEQDRQKQFDVTVALPETTKDIHFSRPTRVTGTVRVEGLSKPPTGRILLFIPKDGGSGASVPIKAGGSYEVALEPGTYTVGLDDSPGKDILVPLPSDRPHQMELYF